MQNLPHSVSWVFRVPVTLGSHHEPVGNKLDLWQKITIICHSDFSAPVTLRSCDGKMFSHPTPTKYPERIQNSSKACTSIMVCGNTAGEVAPPYVNYKAEKIWSTWTKNSPRGTWYNRTKSGWFDGHTFEDWFTSLMFEEAGRTRSYYRQ